MSEDISAPGQQGFRANVAAAVVDGRGHILLARRTDGGGWQLPQGGMQQGENPEEAMFRELQEELGLVPSGTEVLAATAGWHRYQIPLSVRKLRGKMAEGFHGQAQRWFLLRLAANEDAICLNAEVCPEFDSWRWVTYWYPVNCVVEFKREAYRQGLTDLSAAHSIFCRRQQKK